MDVLAILSAKLKRSLSRLQVCSSVVNGNERMQKELYKKKCE